jgi:hypothetical protein
MGRVNIGYKNETQLGLLVAYTFKATGWPDPHMLLHSHVKDGEADVITDITSDKLFIEWVYIVDIEANRLHVLSHAQIGKQREGLLEIGAKEGYEERSRYGHFLVASLDLNRKDFPKIPDAYSLEVEETIEDFGNVQPTVDDGEEDFVSHTSNDDEE